MPRVCPVYLILSLVFLTNVDGLLSSGVLAQATPASAPIQYTVDLDDARNHYLTITARFTPDKIADQTEVMMAVWTPGSYLVREYARHIDSMTVTDGDGKPLNYEKIRKNRWLVDTQGTKSFDVKYRLYCNEMSVRTNWVGLQYAMINGAPTFITLADQLDSPHIVQLKLPKKWTRSATSLVQAGAPHRYLAENFDELVDSPIVAGNISVYPFEAGGVEHQLVNVGESGYWDGAKAATDLKKMVEEHHRMWGSVPYSRYLFLNMINESGGGLEHDNSTLIMTSRWSFRDESRYESWLSLASHEFFHTWNVRRLRPKSLVRYDYENEVYTNSLWVAEGITSYYQDLALVRAGLIDNKSFLKRLSRNVEGVQRTVGRKLQSLKESSYDTWIKYYRPDENSSNTRISYYSKGAVAAFLLDVKIRKLTAGAKSLDDVMRIMFERFAKSGYTPDDFRKVANEVAGQDLGHWFATAIDSTAELDYRDLEFVGVAVPKPAVVESADDEGDDSVDVEPANAKLDAAAAVTSVESESKDKSSDEANKDKPAGKPWIGLSASGDSRVSVSSVVPGSPAYEAGLNTGDEVIAINGFRVSGSVDSRLKQFEVGDTIEILIARRGKLLTLPVIIGDRESESWRLSFVSKPTDEQKAQLDLWLSVADDDESESEE